MSSFFQTTPTGKPPPSVFPVDDHVGVDPVVLLPAAGRHAETVYTSSNIRGTFASVHVWRSCLSHTA